MDAVSKVLADIMSRDNNEDGDYLDEEDCLVCGKCHTPKQKMMDWPVFGTKETTKKKLPIMCQCETDERDRKEDVRKRHEFMLKVSSLRKNGLTDPEYYNWTFERDDRRQSDISDACQKYVNEWAQMRADNVGLLFFGGVGTGKSFFACCIANALLDKCVPTLVTNFPRILNTIQSAVFDEDRNKVLNELQRYELVVIDDLGVERSTDYGMEQIYSVIDTRYRSGKPLIVTTNLSPAEIKNPGNLAYERIYDRILQNSIPVKMSGSSRRSEIAAQKREKYQDFLGFKA